MNHLNISARVVDRWLKKRGWKRTSTTLGGLAYIDPETKTKRPPAVAVQAQMEIEVREEIKRGQGLQDDNGLLV